MIRNLVAFLFVTFLSSFAWGQDCAGFERVNGYKSEIAKSCLGLAATESQVPWAMPRQLMFENESSLLVSDLGGWKFPTAGKVFRINLKNMSNQVIYQGGRFTHGLGKDSQSRILIGDADKILRQTSQGFQSIITGLPTEGSHPLTQFIVLTNNDLVVNVGAPSDNCSKQMNGGTYCPDRDVEGEVRLYEYQASQDSYNPTFKVLGRGLRNSMALLYNPILDVVYQGENSMDALGTPEELNVIPLNQEEVIDYGWPFCMGLGQQSGQITQSFTTFCRTRSALPLFLIPSHSAPLDMDYYFGSAFPQLEESILMGWHGHRRKVEDALVAYPVNSEFEPLVTSRENNPSIQVLSGLNNQTGEKIRPVGVATDSSGFIWFVDDVTKRLYIFASSDHQWVDDSNGQSFEEKNREFVDQLSNQAINEFTQVYDSFMSAQTCTQCHASSEFPQDASEALVQFLNKSWIKPGQVISEMTLISRMDGTQTPRSMPPKPELPFGATNPKIFNDLKVWLETNL